MGYALTDLNTVRALLRAHGHDVSKRLGQNFLVDAAIPAAIARAGCGGETCGVLEIGPGVGALTVELAQRAARVAAVELDETLLPLLREVLCGFSNVTVVPGDVLKLDLAALLREQFAGLPVRVCANLPYYITSPIVLRLLEERLPFEQITVMVQREVALRYAAAPGTKDYGAVSAAVQWYSEPELLFDVPPDCFFPQPKVTSTVLALRPRGVPPHAVCSEAELFRLVKAAFAMRRKTLANCLAAAGYPKELFPEAFAAAGVEPGARGETLGLPQFAALTNYFHDHALKT